MNEVHCEQRKLLGLEKDPPQNHPTGLCRQPNLSVLMRPKGCVFNWNYCWWLKSCTSWYGRYPLIYRGLYIPGGAGFLPSTVPPNLSNLRYRKPFWFQPPYRCPFLLPKNHRTTQCQVFFSMCSQLDSGHNKCWSSTYITPLDAEII